MLGVFAEDIQCGFFRFFVCAVHHKDVGIVVNLAVGKQQKYYADDGRADDSQRDHACTDDNAHRQRPEQKHDLHRLFDGGTEADDGQRTHHAERQNYIGCDGHNDQRRDKGQPNQRQCKAAGI